MICLSSPLILLWKSLSSIIKRPRATSFGGKSRVYQPKPARDSKATIQSHASEWIENNPEWKRLEGPIAVRITAVFKCPTSDYRKRNPRLAKFKSNGPDLDNVAKHYMDALCASGIVCDDDRQVIGNGLPDFSLGWTNTMNIGNLDISMFWNGEFGHDLLSTYRGFYENTEPTTVGNWNVVKTSYYDAKVDTHISFVGSHISALPKEVLSYVEQKKITAGHAKILVGLENALFLANKFIEKKLSVRQAENLVKILRKSNKKVSGKKDPNIFELENSISEKIGLSVSIKNNKNNKGVISFYYKELEQLNKIIDLIKSGY